MTAIQLFPLPTTSSTLGYENSIVRSKWEASAVPAQTTAENACPSSNEKECQPEVGDSLQIQGNLSQIALE